MTGAPAVRPPIAWPEGKRFAFTVVDDTDLSTVDNVGPVYDLLHDCGIRTTKTVWPLSPRGEPFAGGSTLEDPAYRDWVLGLRDRGFEIALHGASDETSARDRIAEALDRFREVVGRDPRLHANHMGQDDALYWGADRLDGATRLAYRAARGLVRRGWASRGHVAGSPHFWGDLCHERINYVRNFVFREIDTLAVDPLMPYHDPRRPFVRHWFSASQGNNLESCRELLAEANQDRLVESGGACVVYTHFGLGFAEGGRVDARFEALIRRLAALPGWFVPASTLLDHVGEHRGWPNLDREGERTLGRMQRRWLLEKARDGRSR